MGSYYRCFVSDHVHLRIDHAIVLAFNASPLDLRSNPAIAVPVA